MHKLATLTLAAALAMSAAAVAQTTWYVKHECPGPSYVGTRVDPFCSIQDGINAAADGDTVLVLPGAYEEIIDLLGKGIHLRGSAGAGVTMIDAHLSGVAVTCTNGEGLDPNHPTVISGLTITGGYTTTGNGGGMIVVGSAPRVVNCVFKDNEATDGGAVHIAADSTARFANCAFLRNLAIHGGSPLGGAIHNYGTLELLNCTFWGNHAQETAGGGAFVNIGGSALAENCIFWGDTPNEIVDLASGQTTVRYSCVSGGWSGPGEGNHAVDPRFVDTSNDDLHLSTGSPCIDGGDSTVIPTDLLVDLDGYGRLTDCPVIEDVGVPTGIVPVTVDLGAYEQRRGDLDRDFDVDLSDLAELLSQYGT